MNTDKYDELINNKQFLTETFDGLMKLRDPLAVAKQRGVSLKKVFNG